MSFHECNIFKQDGAPCHPLKLMSDFFNKKNIKMLDWPIYCPDLNPIRNLWAILKDKVADEDLESHKDLKMATKRL